MFRLVHKISTIYIISTDCFLVVAFIFSWVDIVAGSILVLVVGAFLLAKPVALIVQIIALRNAPKTTLTNVVYFSSFSLLGVTLFEAVNVLTLSLIEVPSVKTVVFFVIISTKIALNGVLFFGLVSNSMPELDLKRD